MTLYTQALDTYKAIHGQPPQHTPYKGASDTPFLGISVDLVSELCDERKVKDKVKNWKKQYTLNTHPTETSHRFIKVLKGGRTNKDVWNNSIWVPHVNFKFSYDEGFQPYEVEDSADRPEVHIISITRPDLPLDIFVSKKRSYAEKRIVYKDRIKSRIPNPGERDLFDLLTNAPWISSITDSAIKAKWKNDGDKYRSIRRVDMPDPEFFFEMNGVKRVLYPQAVVHTSHGYPMILCTTILNSSLNISAEGTEIKYIESKSSNLRWSAGYYFPSEVIRISDHQNTISNRLSFLQGDKK